MSHDDDVFAQIARKTMDTIEKYGHEVRYIFPVDPSDRTAFAYTVGRTLKGRPELLVTGGISKEVMHFMCNEAAAIDDKTPLMDGMELPAGALLEGFPVRVVAADPVDGEMYGAIDLFGLAGMSALQLVWPDMDGDFPGDPDYSLPEYAQPLYPEASCGREESACSMDPCLDVRRDREA